MPFTGRCQRVGDGVVLIDPLRRGESSDRYRVDLVVALELVDIHTLASRGHDHVVVHASGGDTAFLTSPRHYRGRGSQTSLEDLVPSDHLLAVLVYDLLHALYEIALQFLLGGMFLVAFQAFLTDTGLTKRAFLPARLRALIASDMEILARE